ncbi:MAG TPA: hypothetical protein DCP92_15650, partial [Nitrospiraceae bacterium]|nr:hypothetical protein [Nitrospiraceae bacterium]
YAYDGSGKIHRTGKQQIAVFSGGQKIYNADLNASYHIARAVASQEALCACALSKSALFPKGNPLYNCLIGGCH